MESGETVRLSIKVVPGASHEGLAGWLGEALKVRVREPPERGRANTAVERLLARALDLPPRQVRVIAGQSSPRKTVEITGRSEVEIRARVSQS